jgi:hypothetical protein
MRNPCVACLCALATLTPILVDAGGAKAIIFTVGGQDYDVTTFNATHSGNESKFATPGNGGVMPWWGDSSLAQQFATAVGVSLGTTINPGPGGSNTRGPYFVYALNSGTLDSWNYNSLSSGIENYTGIGRFGNFTYAQASLVPSPAAAPGPLPLLGAATAFGISRRLRRRIASQQYKL